MNHAAGGVRRDQELHNVFQRHNRSSQMSIRFLVVFSEAAGEPCPRDPKARLGLADRVIG